MEIKIKGIPKEVADLVVAIQGQPEKTLTISIENGSKGVRDFLREAEHFRNIKCQFL